MFSNEIDFSITTIELQTSIGLKLDVITDSGLLLEINPIEELTCLVSASCRKKN